MIDRCLGMGKFSHFYLYVFGAILFKSLKDMTLDNSYILEDKQVLQNIYIYFGFIVFGTIFQVVFRKNQQNNKRKNKINITQKITNDLKGSKDEKLIYNDNADKFYIPKKEGLLIISICLIYVLDYEILNILYYFKFYNIEFWTFDIFFSIILMHLYFPNSIYKHQIYSMLFVAVIDSILLISSSFCKTYDKSKNIYQYLGNDLCIFAIIIFTSLSFLIFFARINGKILMDNYYISPYKFIIIIGVLGLIIDIIISIIFALIDTDKKCKEKKKGVFNSIFCYYYLSNYFSLFSHIKKHEIFFEIILSLFNILFNFMSLLCELLIIKYLNPNYILWTDNLYYEIYRIKNALKYNFKGQHLLRFIIIQIAELIEFIGCSIYLELIELKCFDLNFNTKKNIMIRSIKEAIEESFLSDDLSEDENSVKSGLIEIV